MTKLRPPNIRSPGIPVRCWTSSTTERSSALTSRPAKRSGRLYCWLINNGSSAANDFTLPNGDTLASPLSPADLQTYINAWRVPQQDSLLDYGVGQTTTTFTDVNFATNPLTLADCPRHRCQCGIRGCCHGITDPGVMQAMELDYITSGGNQAELQKEARPVHRHQHYAGIVQHDRASPARGRRDSDATLVRERARSRPPCSLMSISRGRPRPRR